MTNRLSLKSLNKDSFYMHTARDPMHGPWRAVLLLQQGGRGRHGDSRNGPRFSPPVCQHRSNCLVRPTNGCPRPVGPEAPS